VQIPYSKTIQRIIEQADRQVLKAKLLKQGDIAVVVSGMRAIPGHRYMIEIHRIGDIGK